MPEQPYSSGVMQSLREYLEDTQHGKEAEWDAIIASWTPEEALKVYLHWEGIIGYDSAILNILRHRTR